MKRISQREIANLLRVNVSTVSRALRGLEGVSSELRQKILSLAKERGYRPNPFAVSLRYDTTRTIGIVVPDVSFNHYAHIVKRIEAEARKEGYMCIITDSDDKYETEKNCGVVDKHACGRYHYLPFAGNYRFCTYSASKKDTCSCGSFR